MKVQQMTNSVPCDSLPRLRSRQRGKEEPSLEGSEKGVSKSGDKGKTVPALSNLPNSPQAKQTVAQIPRRRRRRHLTCPRCGGGPFRSLKMHMWHCSSLRAKYQCSMCKKQFPSEDKLKGHYMPLYACHVCSQVFPQESMYQRHQCPKENIPPLVLFCSETMPKACHVCKSFFTSEKTLLNHVTKVHTSVVSTKICIITNPAALKDKNISQAGEKSQKNHVDQTKSLSTSCSDRLSATSSSPARVISSPTDTASPPADLTIVSMFENDSGYAGLMKRMNTAWRAKASYSCRQCGATSRQPSLVVRHRYRHRGRRHHRCQCGRTFTHSLHLLRHCVQHAEATGYICASCGETFHGARPLAEHIQGKAHQKVQRSGRMQKCTVKKECRVAFTCDCGQLFLRPSAYIWHQLKNRRKFTRLKKALELTKDQREAISSPL